jgi:hypothetical protein
MSGSRESTALSGFHRIPLLAVFLAVVFVPIASTQKGQANPPKYDPHAEVKMEGIDDMGVSYSKGDEIAPARRLSKVKLTSCSHVSNRENRRGIGPFTQGLSHWIAQLLHGQGLAKLK